MPHPDYILPRDLAAALARIPQAAHYLTSWYQSGNHAQAATALRTAGIHALRATGDASLSSQEREEVGRMVAQRIGKSFDGTKARAEWDLSGYVSGIRTAVSGLLLDTSEAVALWTEGHNELRRITKQAVVR